MTSEEPRPPEQMPKSIGRYEVQEAIGYGAMGAVYKAFDPLIKRTLAIKTIRLDISRNSPEYQTFLQRFYHEARISGTLSHPNIVTLFDIGEANGLPFLVMEFVEGKTVEELITKGTRFRPEKVIALVSQVASALDYAHGRGIIHRDIKPSNLILYEEDRVKVTDFGIAKLVGSEMTQAGQLLGTPSYMSPEQAMGEKLDGRSDIFSLGVCAFEMLSGEQPFPGANVTSILYKLVHVDPVEPANLEMNGLVPEKWHEVFGKVLAKKPDERYQTGAEFVRDLEYCLGSWFGSAMPADESASLDATIVSTPVAEPPPPPAPPAAAPKAEATKKAFVDPNPTPPSSPPEGVEEETIAPTLNLPVVSPPAAKAAAAPPSPEEELPPTVSEPRPSIPEESEATVAIPVESLSVASKKAPPEPAATTKVPRPTVTPPKPPPAGTVPPGEGEGATVLMDAGQLAAARSKGAEAPDPEKTFVMEPPPTRRRSAPARTPAPPSPPRPGGSSLGLVLGLIGLLLVGVLAGGGYLAWRALHAGPEPQPTPETTPSTETPSTAPQAVTGSLLVKSEPGGAVVTVNGVERGTTPLEIGDLAPGLYEVGVELDGYESRSESVALTKEQPRAELQLTLSRVARPKPSYGIASIRSVPPGSAVSIDGTAVGMTPLTGFRLPPGSHQVEIRHEGHRPWKGKLTVRAGRESGLEARLEAESTPTPTPVPTATPVDTNRVYMNTKSQVDELARKVSGSSAGYPDGAPRLKSGESISVSISFVVNEAGDVTEAKVVESAGKVLDEAVLSAIKSWKYSPATKRGVPVKVRITLKQTFRAG